MIFKLLKKLVLIFAVPFVLILSNCGPATQQQNEDAEGVDDMAIEETPNMADEVTIYRGEIQNMNFAQQEGQSIDGTVTITVNDDIATVEVEAYSLPPNMMHLQHFHGFEDGNEAECPEAEADKNGDGIIDLIETQESAGITMIPLHDNPLNLEIKTETYPQAAENGDLKYSTSFSVSEMQNAVKEKYGLENFDFNDFVLFIHSVNEGQNLPETVQSLPGVPAHITLPIACAELEQVEGDEVL